MTLDEIKKFWGNSYQFEKTTGWNHSNYINWRKKGYVPIKSQIKLQHLSEGKLIADVNHCGMPND